MGKQIWDRFAETALSVFTDIKVHFHSQGQASTPHPQLHPFMLHMKPGSEEGLLRYTDPMTTTVANLPLCHLPQSSSTGTIIAEIYF